jgi:uncharacterized protein
VTNSFLVWFKSHLPTPDSIGRNRWMRPFAKYLMRPDLWHLNRRSVPRAVAIGLFVAPIIPVAHTGAAALLAVPVRANIVIAAAVTWIINPFTYVPFYYSAYKIGNLLVGPAHATSSHVVVGKHIATSLWSGTLGPAALGTFVLATLIASVGYLLSSFLWRIRIGRKWRARRHRFGSEGGLLS